MLHLLRQTVHTDRAAPLDALDALDAAAATRLIQLAKLHRVTPLLASFSPVKNHPEFVARLDTIRRQNLMMVTEIKRILSVFNAHDIPVIPLKGVPLAQRAYGSLFAREVRDLDVLVKPEHVDTARAILLADGYRWLESYLTPHDEHAYRARKLHYTLHHDERNIHLELHWALMRSPDITRLDEWWARTHTETLWGERAVLFAPEDELLSLLLHGSKHGWSDFIWACDVAVWIQRFAPVDWHALYERASAYKARRFVAFGVLMVAALLDMDFPDAALSPALADKTALALASAQCASYFDAREQGNQLTPDALRQQWQLRETWGARLGYARAMVEAWQPSPRDEAFLRLPRRLRGLYPLVRLVRIGVQYGGALLSRKKT